MTTIRLARGLSLIGLATVVAPLGVIAQENQAGDWQSAVEQAVLDANARMSAAADSLDFDTFFGYMAEGRGFSIVQDGTVFTSLDAVRRTVEASYRGIRHLERQFEQPTVTALSPDAALLVSEGRTTATLNDDRRVTGRFAVSLLFVRQDGGWKVLHGHYSRPAPAF